MATRLAWWTGVALLGVAALYVGTWRVWALTVLTWSMYELCFCPTTCGVVTSGGDPCHNGARGRLFACTDVPGHQQVKADALWRPAGHHEPTARLRVTPGDGTPPAHRRARVPPARGSVESRQRLMAYLAVVGLVAVMVQAAVGLTGS
jgi:hypothetical protein